MVQRGLLLVAHSNTREQGMCHPPNGSPIELFSCAQVHVSGVGLLLGTGRSFGQKTISRSFGQNSILGGRGVASACPLAWGRGRG